MAGDQRPATRDLARHCLRLDLTFHQQHTPGEMIERIDGDIDALTRFFAQLVVQLFGNGLLLIGMMVVLLREDMRVGAAIGTFVVITLLVLGHLRNLAVPHWQRSREDSGRVLVAGQDVRQWPLHQLRSQVGMVTKTYSCFRPRFGTT